MKHCKVCELDISDYHGNSVYCNDHASEKKRHKKFKENNPDYYKIDSLEKRIKHMVNNVRHRSKQNDIPFDLDISDISIPEYCPVLGIKIDYEPIGKSGSFPDRPSIDRIDPKGGYIKGNVRVISCRANTLKSDATVEELELVLADLKTLRNKG